MSLLLIAAMPLIALAVTGLILLVAGGTLSDGKIHPAALVAALAVGVLVGWASWLHAFEAGPPAPISSVVIPVGGSR